MSLRSKNEEKISREGTILTVLFHLLLFLFFWFYYVDSAPPTMAEEGILINFGTSDSGLGNTQPVAEEATTSEASQSEAAAASQAAAEAAKAEAPKPVKDNKVATVEDKKGTALPVKEKKKKKDPKKTEPKKPKKEPKKTTPKKEPKKVPPKKDPPKKDTKTTNNANNTKSDDKPKNDTPPKKEPEKPKIDQTALFPGSKGNNSSGQGNSGNKTDDIGSKMGDVKISDNTSSSTISTGLGNGGVGASVSGRRLLSIPTITDNSQATGKVIVKIKVRSDGTVADAQFQSSGSTTTNRTLVNKAIAAAKKAKFNNDNTAAPLQTGTMSFTFKVQ